ncbi:hypothetical protein [Absidia glauca]|uniref:Uncharacterized protein n=1 Tax=Absidia glauca TaxID=4829 RepID=A0A168QA06_ABSGL|nr:hypothetical protein [Absidia glauca]
MDRQQEHDSSATRIHEASYMALYNQGKQGYDKMEGQERFDLPKRYDQVMSGSSHILSFESPGVVSATTRIHRLFLSNVRQNGHRSHRFIYVLVGV